MNLASIIGKNLKKLRAEKGLKQTELAELLNITPSTYSNYERGANVPDFSVLTAIARFYGVSLDYLAGLSTIRLTSDTVIETKNGKISVNAIASLSGEYREAVRLIVEAFIAKDQNGS